MLTVACVLKSGPEFRVEHVAALAEGVRANLSLPHHFVALTDMVDEVEAIGIAAVRLPQSWPGWFAKICLFRPDLFPGPCLYFDLDTTIVGPLDDLVLGHRFTVLQNFWAPARIGSGLMAWDCDLSAIYEKFCRSPERFMREYVTPERWGDQGFIKDHSPVKPDLWQQKHPGRVVSYRRHILPAGGISEGASVVCYGGKARPWNTPPLERAAA